MSFSEAPKNKLSRNITLHKESQPLTRNCCATLWTSLQAENVRGQSNTKTLNAGNDTSRQFPSDDLPDVMFLCLRSHYSSVIEQNDGAQ